MRRLLLITLAISAVSAFSHTHKMCGHHHHHNHPFRLPFMENMERMHERLFEDISRGLQEVDDKIQRSCGRHHNENTREVVESGQYKIVASVAGMAEEDFDIKIKGRALLIRATKNSTASNPPSMPYLEVRSLPTFVNPELGSFSYLDGVLTIEFPINEAANTCSPVFSDTVRTVPVLEKTIVAIEERSSFPLPTAQN